VSELEAELASKSQSIGSLSSELAELKQKSVNIDDLEHTVRDLQRQLDLARDASDVTQQKNAELRQSLKNKDNQLEVNKIKLYYRKYDRYLLLLLESVHIHVEVPTKYSEL